LAVSRCLPRGIVPVRYQQLRFRKELSDAAADLDVLEPEVNLTRYPGMSEGELWIPSEEYHAEDSEDAMNKARRVMHVAERFAQWWFAGSERNG